MRRCRFTLWKSKKVSVGGGGHGTAQKSLTLLSSISDILMRGRAPSTWHFAVGASKGAAGSIGCWGALLKRSLAACTLSSTGNAKRSWGCSSSCSPLSGCGGTAGLWSLGSHMGPCCPCHSSLMCATLLTGRIETFGMEPGRRPWRDLRERNTPGLQAMSTSRCFLVVLVLHIPHPLA